MSAESGSESGWIKTLLGAFTIPENGTPLRGLVRTFRENIFHIKFEGEQQIKSVGQSVVGSVDEMVDNADKTSKGIELPEDVEVLVAKQRPYLDKFKDVTIKPEIKFGASMLGLTLLSYRFGPRVLLRNFFVGGIIAQQYWFPETIQKAFNRVPTKVTFESEDGKKYS